VNSDGLQRVRDQPAVRGATQFITLARLASARWPWLPMQHAAISDVFGRASIFVKTDTRMWPVQKPLPLGRVFYRERATAFRCQTLAGPRSADLETVEPEDKTSQREAVLDRPRKSCLRVHESDQFVSSNIGRSQPVNRVGRQLWMRS
jgi:hypothetical protein